MRVFWGYINGFFSRIIWYIWDCLEGLLVPFFITGAVWQGTTCICGYQSKRKGKIQNLDKEKSCLEHLNLLSSFTISSANFLRPEMWTKPERKEYTCGIVSSRYQSHRNSLCGYLVRLMLWKTTEPAGPGLTSLIPSSTVVHCGSRGLLLGMGCGNLAGRR